MPMLSSHYPEEAVGNGPRTSNDEVKMFQGNPEQNYLKEDS